MSASSEEKEIKWAGYCRVSTEKQAKEGFSLEAQKLAIEKYCQDNKLKLHNVYTEQVSGTVPVHERNQFKKIIEDLDKGIIRGVITAKFDRLSRDLDDLRAIIKKYFKGDKNNNRKIVFLDCTKLDVNNPQEFFQMTVVGGVSELEVEMIRTRTNIIMNYKKSKSQKLGGYVPWGFKCVEKEEGSKKVKYLEENKEEKDISKELRRLREKESYTYQECADWMNEKKIKNREGKINWTRQNVFKLIYPENLSKRVYKKRQKD